MDFQVQGSTTGSILTSFSAASAAAPSPSPIQEVAQSVLTCPSSPRRVSVERVTAETANKPLANRRVYSSPGKSTFPFDQKPSKRAAENLDTDQPPTAPRVKPKRTRAPLYPMPYSYLIPTTPLQPENPLEDLVIKAPEYTKYSLDDALDTISDRTELCRETTWDCLEVNYRALSKLHSFIFNALSNFRCDPQYTLHHRRALLKLLETRSPQDFKLLRPFVFSDLMALKTKESVNRHQGGRYELSRKFIELMGRDIDSLFHSTIFLEDKAGASSSILQKLKRCALAYYEASKEKTPVDKQTLVNILNNPESPDSLPRQDREDIELNTLYESCEQLYLYGREIAGNMVVVEQEIEILSSTFINSIGQIYTIINNNLKDIMQNREIFADIKMIISKAEGLLDESTLVEYNPPLIFEFGDVKLVIHNNFEAFKAYSTLNEDAETAHTITNELRYLFNVDERIQGIHLEHLILSEDPDYAEKSKELITRGMINSYLDLSSTEKGIKAVLGALSGLLTPTYLPGNSGSYLGRFIIPAQFNEWKTQSWTKFLTRLERDNSPMSDAIEKTPQQVFEDLVKKFEDFFIPSFNPSEQALFLSKTEEVRNKIFHDLSGGSHFLATVKQEAQRFYNWISDPQSSLQNRESRVFLSIDNIKV